MISDANGSTLVEPVHMAGAQSVKIDSVKIGPRHRRLGEAGVESLRVSIDSVGLMHPITVRNDGILIAGAHRLEACRRLGWKDIPANVLEVNDLVAEQMELEENMRSNPLSAQERAEHFARIQEIYHQRGLLRTVGHQPTGGTRIGLGDLAGQFDIGERQAKNWLAVAHLPEEVRDKTRSTPIAESLKELLELAQMDDVAERDSLVAMISTGQATTVQGARKVLHPEMEVEPSPMIDDPGDDTGERYDLVRSEHKFYWKQPNPTMRKRIIDGEERYYRREAIPRVMSININTGPEAFSDDGLRFLCESIARQLYASLRGQWPPATGAQ